MECIIDDLPDPILCHILSFLPTHYAVRTSLLSKRWRNLWTYTDTLNFDCYKKKSNWGKRRFATFVNRTLMYHNVTSSLNKLKKLSLVWTRKCDKENIHAWLYWAITNGVQELNLQNLKNLKENLPNGLYSCKTLEVVELRGEITVHCPESISLPRLKTLRLINVHYGGGEHDVCKLLSSCPVLKSLYVERNEYDNVSKFVICSRVLEKLIIKMMYDNTGSFKSREDELCLEINTPKLEYLNLMDSVSDTYSVVDISSLVRANIEVHSLHGLSNERTNQKVRSFSTLMQALHKVNDLYISIPTLEGKTINWREASHVPLCVYSCLKGISIPFFGLEDSEDELAMLSYILENAQVLQFVKLCSAPSNIQAKYRMLQRISKFPRKSQACRIHFV